LVAGSASGDHEEGVMGARGLISSLFLAGALAAVAIPASADTRDIDSLGVPVGECLASAPDLAHLSH